MTKRRMTVCLADIDRFNVATRNMSPEGILEFLQGFYERAGDVLLAHNGRLVKYIGDAILVTFDAGREEIAVRAMWTLRESFADYADHAPEEAAVASLRVGIATGEVMSGQIGHPQMLAYDVLGRPVVLAGALLQCADLTIDAATYDAIADRVVVEPAAPEADLRAYRVVGFR